MISKSKIIVKPYIFLLLCFGLLVKPSYGEDSIRTPSLILFIVVDQMRFDYLTKYVNRYSEHGFKKLLNQGFSLTNAHFNHLGTYTAVGHASIYTGTTPSDHGIIGNNW